MKRLFCLLALLPAMCAAQATSGFHRVNQVVTRSNTGTYAQVVPGASVYVKNTASGLAAVIYSDPGLTITVPGAIVTTDVNGNYGYYLPLNTCVTENISSPSQGSLSIPNICGNAGLSLPIATLNGGTGTTTAPLIGQIPVGQTGSSYLPETMIGDCTLAYTGSITCLKTNGTPFTAAATTRLGTSGAVIPLLSSANTWSQDQTFSGSSTTETQVNIVNTTSLSWSIQVAGSSQPSLGLLSIIDNTDGVTPITFSPSAIAVSVPMTISGSPVCTTSNGACATGSGTVTSVSAGTLPSWLALTVATNTTTPTLNFVASGIPNSALANSSIIINSTTCTLGTSCSLGTSRTCNANGCYTIAPDGTIQEWGTSSSCGTGTGTYCTQTVTFPYPFTTTAHIAVNPTCVSSRGNCEANIMTGSLSTTGVTVQFASMIYVGGSGGGLDGSQVAMWHASGN